jgi:hypothetical protein
VAARVDDNVSVIELHSVLVLDLTTVAAVEDGTSEEIGKFSGRGVDVAPVLLLMLRLSLDTGVGSIHCADDSTATSELVGTAGIAELSKLGFSNIGVLLGASAGAAQLRVKKK